jgi:hypothetical protein
MERYLGDERLCLFRPPPPWDIVDKGLSATPPVDNKKKPNLPLDKDSALVAQVAKRPGMRQNPMQGMMDNILAMKRRRMDEAALNLDPSTQDPVESHATQPLKKNPFRRK